MNNIKKVQGTCHCEAVQFEIESDFMELTTCDCSICIRKNALMVKVHESAMHIIAGKDYLTTYHFHTNTAEHYFCKICGIYPFHRKRVTPDYFGVNVFCLKELDLKGIALKDIPVRSTVGAGMK